VYSPRIVKVSGWKKNVDEHYHCFAEFGSAGSFFLSFSFDPYILLLAKIWLHVPVDRPGKGAAANATALENVIEKKTMINLVSRLTCLHASPFLIIDRSLHMPSL
jgi:hypothetical protein